MIDRVDRRGMRPARRPADQDASRRALARAAAGTLAPLGVVLIGVLVLVIDGHDVSWLAGLVAGAGAGAWITLHRAAVARRLAARSAAAARAERRTAAAVRPLERKGWRFLHDVAGSDGTYDHIAVGGGGVILLQSLDPQGVVTLRCGTPFVERRPHPDAESQVMRIRPRALADAAAFREDMQGITDCRLWVQAVVVFWSEFPAGVVTDGRCVYIHGSRLCDWIARRPHQLDPADADELFAAVQLLAEAGGEPHRLSLAV